MYRCWFWTVVSVGSLAGSAATVTPWVASPNHAAAITKAAAPRYATHRATPPPRIRSASVRTAVAVAISSLLPDRCGDRRACIAAGHRGRPGRSFGASPDATAVLEWHDSGHGATGADRG